MLSKSVFCIFSLSVTLNLGLAAQSPETAPGTTYISQVWDADLGNGSYRNPIIYADYSDPDVIRVGRMYYMTSSSFNCTPGLPVLRSEDMVHWTIIGHALPKQYPTDHYALPQHGNGCWAPCLRYHKGQFFIYWGDPDFGIYMVQASDPAGPWSVPALVLEGKGLIDPSPLWDDNGDVWLVHGWAGSRAGVNSLLTVNRLNSAGTKALDEGRHVFDGHDAHPTIEGPKFYKRNGYYYIFAPAGGVTSGWQLALRSKNIYGPYEEKIVLEQGTTPVNGPHQGAWVETPEGESWFFHFQDREAYGRILHLQPLKWVDNWPAIGVDLDGNGVGEPVLVHPKPTITPQAVSLGMPAESDEFDHHTLGLQWQWHANPSITWSALLPGTGYLRLFALPRNSPEPNLWNTPNLLLQKFPGPDFTATTKIEWKVDSSNWEGKKAGLLLMGNDYGALVISRDEMGYKASQIFCKAAKLSRSEEVVVAEQRLPSNIAYFRIQVKGPNAQCQFSLSTDGRTFSPIGEPFLAQPDTWIGAKVGLFCTSLYGTKRGGYADFDWFRVGK